MKKFVKVLITALAVVCLALAFTGCTIKVSGKKFSYTEVTVQLPEDATEDEKAVVGVVQAAVEKLYKSTSHTFKDDGSYEGTFKVLPEVKYTWKQDGKKVTVFAGDATVKEFSVNGRKLFIVHEAEGYSFKVVFTEK